MGLDNSLAVPSTQYPFPTHLLSVTGIVWRESDLPNNGAVTWIVVEHHHAVS